MTTTVQAVAFGNDPNKIDEVAEIEFNFIVQQGRARKDAIRAHCKEQAISTDLYQSGFERLTRQLNFISEVVNEDKTKGWVVQEWCRGKAFMECLGIVASVTGQKKQRETFGDWYETIGVFRLTSHALASQPNPLEQSSRVFLRGVSSVLLVPGYFRAMFKAALNKPFAPPIGNAQYHVDWDLMTMPESSVGLLLRPVPPARKGMPGQGITSCEAFDPGVEIPFKATLPGTHVHPHEFESILQIAGSKVGFSPAAAHLGFGRFTPEIR